MDTRVGNLLCERISFEVLWTLGYAYVFWAMRLEVWVRDGREGGVLAKCNQSMASSTFIVSKQYPAKE